MKSSQNDKHHLTLNENNEVNFKCNMTFGDYKWMDVMRAFTNVHSFKWTTTTTRDIAGIVSFIIRLYYIIQWL